MKALIINDSEGNRLRPITCTIPKTMLPVLGRPVCEHTVRLLRRHNISDISIVSDYLPETVKNHFLKNNIGQVKISFPKREEIASLISSDDTLIISGSILTDINLEKLIEHHIKNNAAATFVTRTNADFLEYGVVSLDDNKYICEYNRATYPAFCMTRSCFMGIMLVSSKTDLSSHSSLCSIAQALTESGEKIVSYTSKEYIQDICDSEVYFRVTRDFLDKKINLPFPCDEKENGVWIDKDATIARGAIIVPPVYIGPGTVINRGVRIEDHSSIGKDCTINSFASIKRSIVMDNALVCEGSSVRAGILCEKSELGVQSAMYESSVIGGGTKLGNRCILRPSVRVWPEKFIEDDSIISSNIVWENLTPRSMFFDGCVSGRINNEITPEFASLLGCACASVLGNKIGISGTSGYGSNMIKNALISGAQSFGAETFDFGEQPLPITRSGIYFYKLDGGISISTYEKNDELYACIDIINSSGANIDDDTLFHLEGIVNSGEVKRISPQGIKDISYLLEYKLYYLRSLINSVKKADVSMKILINCQSEWAKKLLQGASSDLNCSFDFTNTSSAFEFASEVQKGAYDFGGMIDPKCEKIILVNNETRILSDFDYDVLTALIIMKSYPSATIYTPISTPEGVELLAEKYGATVVRTKMSPPAIMNLLSGRREKMYTQQFVYRFDAIGALVMLIDFLSSSHITLSALLEEIPSYCVEDNLVDCPSKEQTDTIKKVALRHKKEAFDLEHALKLNFKNGWALIVPSNVQNTIRIIAHSFSEEYAREIADMCTDDITN